MVNMNRRCCLSSRRIGNGYVMDGLCYAVLSLPNADWMNESHRRQTCLHFLYTASLINYLTTRA
jgi:hypothetical protein